MVMKEDKQRLRKVLLDAISLLCKNGLPVETEFCIEATIGITLNEDDVVLVSFKEIIKPDQVPSAGSFRVRSDLNRRQSIDEEPILSGPAVENHSGDIDNKINDLLPDTINQIDTDVDTELICDELKKEYEPFRVPETITRSGISKRKRPFEYPTRMPVEGTILNTESAVSEVNYRQTFRHSVSGQPKLRRRQAVSEECVNDVPVTIKEETRDVIDNNYAKGEDEHIEWSGDADNVGQEDDSWMFQEVYDSDGSSYNNTSSYSVSRPQSNHTSQHVKLDSDVGLPGRLCKIDTILQSWNTLDVTKTEEGLGSQALNSRRQWTPARSVSSLDQGAIVSRALQSLTRAAAFDQSAASLQTGDSTAAAAVFCQICGARLASAATLVKHIKGTHLAMSMCQCEICGEQFKWTMQLCRHRKRYHANEVAAPLAGEELDGTFDSDQVILD